MADSYRARDRVLLLIDLLRAMTSLIEAVTEARSRRELHV